MSAAPTVPATGQTPETKPAASGLGALSLGDVAAPVVAILSLLGFGALILYLIGRAVAATELEWTRSVYLLNGVEAVAFAAAGFLFGKEVHRQQAEKAEMQAEKATDRAQTAEANAASAEKTAAEVQAKTDAMKAWADAKAAQQRRQGPPPSAAAPGEEPFGPRQGPRAPAAAAPGAGQVDVDELQTMIHELFG